MSFLAGKYLHKANHKNIKKMFKIDSQLTIKTQEQRQKCCAGIFIFNFEHISIFFLVFLSLALNR